MPHSWERTTKEVVFYPCPICCQRLEVELDNSGTSLGWLHVAVTNHFVMHHYKEHLPGWKELQLMARTETIDLYATLDLSDIISKRSLRRRALTLAGSCEDSQRTLIKLKSRIRTLVVREGHYVCKLCGKRITKKRAEKYGYGVSHTADEIQAKNQAERLSSTSAPEGIQERGQIRAILSASHWKD